MYTFVKGEPNWVDPLNANFQEIAMIAGGAIPSSEKGAAGGVATLDSDGKLAQMPTAGDVGAADQEYGTWTPALYARGVSVSATYTLQEGYFSRVGRIVVAHFRIVANVSNASEVADKQVWISGGPFTAVDSMHGGALVHSAPSGGYMEAFPYTAGSAINLMSQQIAGFLFSKLLAANGGVNIYGEITYRIA